MANNRFRDIRLPDRLSLGAVGGPLFKTTIVEMDSGFEKANRDWMNAKAKYDIGHVAARKTTFREARDFFWVNEGRAFAWRFHDHADDDVGTFAAPQPFATGDGIIATFQCSKRYQAGAFVKDRPIQCIWAGSYSFFVNGVQVNEGPGAGKFTLDPITGLVTFGTVPPLGAVIAWTGRFDVPCRFDTDWGNWSMDIGGPNPTDGVLSWPSIPIVSYRIRP